MNYTKTCILAILTVLGLSAGSFAYDEDMDTYRKFREELATIRDSYATNLNMAMEDAMEGDPAGWFNARAEGLDADWHDLEFEPPTVTIFAVDEIPYGFRISGREGEYKLDVKVTVTTRDADIWYVTQFLGGTNAAAKEIVNEVFKNAVSDYVVNCPKDAVTCYKGKFTYGELKKSKKK